jgi:AraC family transcriptional regulator
MAPSEYRQRGFLNHATRDQAQEHARVVRDVGPCIGLYHINHHGRLTVDHMPYTVTKTQLTPQLVIVGRKRVKRSDIAATIGEVLPHFFQFAQQRGIALTGHPLTRYVDVGPGLITMEPGMRIASPGQDPLQIDPSWLVPAGEAEVRSDTLPGGPAAMTVHMGPYDKLTDAYAAIQEWMESNGVAPAGAPWECYITDPAEHPNPADWKTEVFWPIRG